MQKKTISLLLCLAMVISMLAVGFTSTSAATADTAATGTSKIESPDDFSWDNVNLYFLLTDRFYNGDTSNDHAYGRALDANGNPISGWNTSPATFHGGDFKGLTQKINEGYFDDLGVNAIWISAPYEQIHGYVTPGGDNDWAHYSYHGYYVLDYTETDANYGTKAEFKTLVDTAHSHGIRVVMDVVMNHAGYNTIRDMYDYGFNAFKDDAAAQSYLYRLTNVNGMHDEVIDYQGHQAQWANWWGSDWIRAGLPGYSEQPGSDLTNCLTGLPDFRTESTNSVSIPPILKTKWTKEGTYNAKVAKYGSSHTVSDYISTWLAEWVETYGVDGFRCDTAKHVELASWKKLKTKAQQALQTWRRNNPTAVGADWDEDFWMTGECWDYKGGYGSYYTEGGFDSMINFSFSGSPISGGSALNGVYQGYADSINSNPNYNLLTYNSSHDSDLARGDLYYQGTSLLLLPGGVQPFYGDETNRPKITGIGNDTHGGSGHSLRSDMNWSTIDQGVLAHWQKVGQFRKNHVAVGAGQHQQITAYNSSTGYTFSRFYDDGEVTDGVICCILAPANQQIAVDVSSMWGNGTTVTNEYDGTTAVVQNGKATFNSGAHGTILIAGPQSTISMSLSGQYGFYDSQTVTVSLRGADYAMVSVAGGTPFRVVDGQTFEIGDGIDVGQVFTVEMTATNSVETLSKSFNFKKKDPNDVTTVYFDNTAYNWSSVYVYVYKGDGDSATSIKEWPGEPMEYDSEKGLYFYEVDEDFAGTGAVVFNANGGSQYPPKGTRLEINGTSMVLINGTSWVPYEGQIIQPTEPPAPGTQRTIYLDNNTMKYGNPSIYVWKNGTQEKPNPWPGVAMTPASDVGAGYYKFTCDSKYDCCIFLDGSTKKTDDLNVPYLNAVYDGSWKQVQEPTVPTQPTDPTDPTDPPVDEKILLGDANQDSKVSIKDVTAVQRHIAELEILTGDGKTAADVNKDSLVSIKDATLIQLYLIQKNAVDNHTGEYTASGQNPTVPTVPTEPTVPPTTPTEPAKTVTLVNGSFIDNNKEDWFAWTWSNDSDGRWLSGTGDASAYVFTGDFGANILFVRVPKGQQPSWEPRNVWNQTPNTETHIGGTYVIKGWYYGEWQ